MSEILPTMASINLAMEIRPADITPASSAPSRQPLPRDAHPEPFKDVLARVEKKGETSQKKAAGTEADATARLHRDAVRKKAEPGRENAQEAETANPPGSVSAETPADIPKETGEAGTQGSPSPEAVNGLSVESGPAVIMQHAATGFVLELLSAAAVPESAPSVTGEITGSEPGPLDGIPRILPELLLPAMGESEQIAQPVGTSNGEPIGSGETAVVGADTIRVAVRPDFIGPGRPEVVLQAPEPVEARESGSLFVQLPVSGSTQPADVAPGPRISTEWTNVLELNRLLDPGFEPIKPGEDQVWRPADPIRPEPRLNPDSSRIDGFVSSKSTEEPIGPSVWPAAAKPDPVLQQAAGRDFLAFVQGAYRPPVILTQQASPAPAGAPVASTGGVLQAQPSAPVQIGGVRFEIDPELLVSDVREAVIRIAADGRGEARITLHPPELGELVVRLESARNGIVRAEFHTMSPLVREALEAGLSKLTQALEAEGLTLAQADVHLGFQLGAQNSGDTEPGPFGGRSAAGASAEPISTGSDGDMSPVVERLPEGATISILA